MSRSVSEVIRTRRSITRFQVDVLPAENLIRRGIEHATWAPNHYLSQPWRFYLLGPDTVDRICRLNAELVQARQGDKAAEIKLQRWRSIPGWLLLTCGTNPDTLRRHEDYAACCCAAQNMMLYLWDQGIGMKWTTGEVTRDERFFRIVGIAPDAEEVVGLFWYGLPAESPESARQPVETVITQRP